MPLTLTVDGDRWRRHLRAVADEHPGLVPVAKGNGYGLGLARLARRAGWLGVDQLAVGTYEELPEVASRFDGDLLVLSPWRLFAPDLEAAHGRALARRVVHTVGRVADVEPLLARQPDARIAVELATTMRRHGLAPAELRRVVDLLAPAGRPGSARVAGLALHLPLAVGGVSHLDEARRLLEPALEALGPVLARAGHRRATVWVSHLASAELATLRAAHPDVDVRPRIGTALWLGDPAALHVSATVVDVHPLRRGDVFGYRGRTAARAGHLLVVSGGTGHGIGLESPTGELSLRSRAATVARGGLDAAGRVRSPFRVDGRQALFAEPPHMQVSMLLCPPQARVPEVGDVLDVRVRHTTTTFDEVRFT